MSGKACDWWMDRVLFLPMNLAQGRGVAVKLLAVIVYPPWFMVFSVLGLPLLACAVLSEVWASLK